MTKRQLIDQIVSLNETADAGFLAQFPDGELDSYLQHLTAARMPRPWGWKTGRYDPNRPAETSPGAAAEPTTAAGEPGGFFEDVRGVIQARLF